MTPQQRQSFRHEIAKADESIRRKNTALTARQDECLPGYSEIAQALRSTVGGAPGAKEYAEALLARIPV